MSVKDYLNAANPKIQPIYNGEKYDLLIWITKSGEGKIMVDILNPWFWLDKGWKIYLP